MPLTYHPEFATAAAAMLNARSALLPLAAGDVEGRRSRLEPLMERILRAMPATSNVTREIYECSAVGGRKVAIHHHHLVEENGEDRSDGPAIVYVHSGGLFLGSVDWFDHYVAKLVERTGVPFFSVEYGLAPEHRGTSPAEDCYAAIHWIHQQAAKLKVDLSRIGIYGESAGGGIAAGTALLARDRGLDPPLAKQILINPMLDDRNTGEHPSIAALATWTTADNVTGWGALLGGENGFSEVLAYASPARAIDLAGLPDTYIDVGVVDIFRDESMDYVSRLIQAEVMVEFHLYPGLPHGFEGLAPDIDLTQSAYENRCRAARSF